LVWGGLGGGYGGIGAGVGLGKDWYGGWVYSESW